MVKVKINDKEIGAPQEIRIEPDNVKDSRFLSWLNILAVLDKKNKINEIAVIQRMKKELRNGIGVTESEEWRVIHVKETKEVLEEEFNYLNRGEHPLGVKLVQISNESSSMIGFKSVAC